MAKDNSNVISLQAARQKAAEAEVRKMKAQAAAATGRAGPLSKLQLALLAAAVVLAYLAVQFYSSGGIAPK